MVRTTRFPLALGLLLLPLACAATTDDSEDSGAGCRGGKCDDVDGFPCTLVDKSNGDNGTGKAEITGINDPLAQFVFKAGDSCPTGFKETIAKLREFDTQNCEDRESMRSAAVSETAQVMGRNTSYRAVTTRDCGRSSHSLLFSMFGLQVDSGLPQNLEAIAFDQDAGVFNYYTFEGGEWGFHGDSKDFITGESGSRCAACHTGGGLIMKELAAPWLHWEGDTTTPGANELIDGNDELGDVTDGVEVEDIVRSGNTEWNRTRLTHLLEQGDVGKLLEPLFCTVEMNIESGSSSPNGNVFGVPSSALVDNRLSFASVNLDDDAYRAALGRSGQSVRGGNGQALKDSDGNDVLDSHFPFSFPARSGADADYVGQLSNGGVIDNEFVSDVLSIDFTRPIFSDDRCGLLRFAPDIEQLLKTPDEPEEEPGEVDTGNCCQARSDSGCSIESIESCVCEQDDFCCNDEWDSTCVENVESFSCGDCGNGGSGGGGGNNNVVDDLEDQIRAGFIANLEAESPDLESPAGQLLLALQQRNDEDRHRDRVQAFANACGARDQAAMIDDVLKVVSLRRNEARALPVMEFPATLPFDNNNTPAGSRLNPLTCEMSTSFTALIGEDDGGECGLFIAEVMYDASDTDNGHEWVKLYNSCDDDRDLAGLSLGWGGDSYRTGGVDLSGTVAAGECLIVGGPNSNDTNGNPDIGVEMNFSPDLQNSGSIADGVALFDVSEDNVLSGTTPLDAVIYGGSNDSGLRDSRGDARQPHVGDAPGGASILRTDAENWTISMVPDASSCPDF